MCQTWNCLKSHVYLWSDRCKSRNGHDSQYIKSIIIRTASHPRFITVELIPDTRSNAKTQKCLTTPFKYKPLKMIAQIFRFPEPYASSESFLCLFNRSHTHNCNFFNIEQKNIWFLFLDFYYRCGICKSLKSNDNFRGVMKKFLCLGNTRFQYETISARQKVTLHTLANVQLHELRQLALIEIAFSFLAIKSFK